MTCFMDNDRKIKIATEMVNEMLQLARAQDEQHKVNAIANNNAEQAIGESWEIFHLKALKELLEENE